MRTGGQSDHARGLLNSNRPASGESSLKDIIGTSWSWDKLDRLPPAELKERATDTFIRMAAALSERIRQAECPVDESTWTCPVEV